jgi:hypothetical protein
MKLGENMSDSTIASGWTNFESTVISATAPEVQRREMKLAFYAGAETLIALLFSAGDKSDEEGMEMIASWQEECRTFLSQIIGDTNTH